jgi:hypothetical protein
VSPREVCIVCVLKDGSEMTGEVGVEKRLEEQGVEKKPMHLEV